MGTFNQLRVALLHGLTYKLFSLYYQIKAIKSELEVRCALLFILQSIMVPQLKVDKQQLNDTETVTGAEGPSPVGKRLDIFLAIELTSDASLMVPSATATAVINHVNEPTPASSHCYYDALNLIMNHSVLGSNLSLHILLFVVVSRILLLPCLMYCRSD